MFIKIDGDILEVESVNDYGNLRIDAEGMEYVIFKSQENAGQDARAYWADMAENDKREFACMVGEKTLVSWALGEYAGPGTAKVSSLGDWLDLWLDTPEEHFASYDGSECRIEFISRDLLWELDDDLEWLEAIRAGEAVAYRCN